MENVKKPMSHWSRVGWSIAGVSLLIILLCVSVGILTQNNSRLIWLQALCFILGGLSVAGVITGVAIVFGKKYEARVIDDLHSDSKNVLARWTYTPEEWNRFVGGEIRQRNKIGLIILPLIFIPSIALLIWAGGGITLITLFPVAIALLIGWAVVYLPGRALRKAGRGEVIISSDGVLLGNQWFSWTYFGARLTSVNYADGNPPIVAFQWMQPGTGIKGASAPQSVRVPVPRGREQEARQLISTLKP